MTARIVYCTRNINANPFVNAASTEFNFTPWDPMLRVHRELSQNFVHEMQSNTFVLHSFCCTPKVVEAERRANDLNRERVDRIK